MADKFREISLAVERETDPISDIAAADLHMVQASKTDLRKREQHIQSAIAYATIAIAKQGGPLKVTGKVTMKGGE